MADRSKVTRRDLLRNVGAVYICTRVGTLQASAQITAQGAASEQGGIGSTQEQRASWIAVAESLKPVLRQEFQPALAVVRPVKDANVFLRWRMETVRPGAEAGTQLLSKGDAIFLDFGGHRAGYLQFDMEGEGRSIDSPIRLRFVFGEVPGDVSEPLYPYTGGLTSAWLPEEIVTVDALPARIQLPRRYAFRYVKVEVIDSSYNFGVHLSKATAIALTSATSTPSAMAPNAPEWARRMDEISLTTLRDCMQTTFEDGPRRDQRLWIGDLRLQARANYVTFKKNDLVKRCLYLFGGLPRERDGYMPACIFEKPVPRTTLEFIMDYVALFASVVLDYVTTTGDTQVGVDLLPVASRQFEILRRNLDANHIFDNKGAWVFVDWNRSLNKEASMQAILVYGLRQLVALAELLGLASSVKEYEGLIDQLVAAARAKYFDATLGVCVSGDARQVSWASQVWMLLGGCLTIAEGKKALTHAMFVDKNAVKPGSAYLYHHVIEAMLLCGMKTEPLSLIESYWGMYIHLAYQSPSSATDCGPQCSHMPIFASRHQEGTLKLSPSDFQVGSTMPAAIGTLMISIGLSL